LVGQTLEAHLYEHTLQLYRGTQLVVTHPRAQSRGERFTRLEHYPQEKALYLERTPEVCQERAQQVGESCHLLVLYLLVQSSADNLRAVQSLVGLESQVGRERLEAACARALHYGDPRYRRVKAILAAGLESAPLTEEGETFAPSPPRTYAHARTPEEFFGSEASSC
ncbi:MAG TPA: hypothetical protein VGN26_18160, partial [Armatimonadota bacterium]